MDVGPSLSKWGDLKELSSDNGWNMLVGYSNFEYTDGDKRQRRSCSLRQDNKSNCGFAREELLNKQGRLIDELLKPEMFGWVEEIADYRGLDEELRRGTRWIEFGDKVLYISDFQVRRAGDAFEDERREPP